MPVPLVAAEGLQRAFDRGRICAVRDASIAIQAGESIAIMGRSGCGKSTLLNLLCGLDCPTAGRVMVDGRVPDSARAWTAIRATRIGLIFQSFNLLPMLTACENVEVAMFGVVASGRDRRARALAILDEVGLASRVDHRPTDLSGGERQRVAIARSLANSPALILADEPTGNLDSTTSSAIIDLLRGLQRQRQTALVLVTHDRAIAASADRLWTMADGQLQAD